MGRSRHRQRHRRRLRQHAKIRVRDMVRFEHEGQMLVGQVVTPKIDVTPWTAVRPHVLVMLVWVAELQTNIAVFHNNVEKLRPPPRDPQRLERWLAE